MWTDILAFFQTMGFMNIDWQQLVMLFVSFFLLYLAIKKQYEPLLLLPIAFGMLLTNLPGANMYHPELWEAFLDADSPAYHSYGAILKDAGLLDVLYIGVKAGLYPCLIFIGVGAMTDFGPLIANPKSLILGAAAQIGIFVTFLCANALGFTPAEAGSIGIIGGADGPTSIFLTSKLAPCTDHQERARYQDETTPLSKQDRENRFPDCHHRYRSIGIARCSTAHRLLDAR